MKPYSIGYPIPMFARRIRPVVSVISAFALVAIVAAQTGVHPLSGRRYAQTMGVEGAEWLDRTERDQEEEPDRAVDILKLQKGATVADIGAGSGYVTERLSKKVGPMGRVYATDIQQGMIDLIGKRIAKRKLTNVTPVLSTQDDPRLPLDAIDLAIMVDVYHELSQPQLMLRHIKASLRPGGRLVLVEYRKEDPNIPIRPEHKMSVAEAKLEVEAEGFKLTQTNEDLPRQHVLIFTRP